MRPEPAKAPAVSDLLRRALAGRLVEVREALRAPAAPKAARSDAGPGAGGHASGGASPAPTDPEESLRRLMVTALPRLRDHPGGGSDRAVVFSLLRDLEAPARSQDLRFLDAWNNACEVLLAWSQGEHRDDARGALESYASLLEAHLKRLGGRP